jgi:Holliday junction resolvase RusA-like endonuclease
MIDVMLPVPPSTNNLFINVRGKGRIKSAEYRAWLDHAGLLLKVRSSKVVEGPFEVEVRLSHKARGDIDNRMKAAIDLMVRHGRVPDDSKMWRATVARDESIAPGECRIIIIPKSPAIAGGGPAPLALSMALEGKAA